MWGRGGKELIDTEGVGEKELVDTEGAWRGRGGDEAEVGKGLRREAKLA